MQKPMEIFSTIGQIDGSRLQEIQCMEAEVLLTKRGSMNDFSSLMHFKKTKLFEVDPYITIVGGLSTSACLEGDPAEMGLIKTSRQLWMEQNDEIWRNHFGELQHFKDMYGHFHIPRRNKEWEKLANWVTKQRQEKKRGVMSEGRYKKLEEIGFFEWDKEGEDKEQRTGPLNQDYLNQLWEENLEKLRKFKDTNGHCRVPVAKKSLNNWVRRQRSIFNKGKMSAERIQKLNLVGFEWKGQHSNKKRKKGSDTDDEETETEDVSPKKESEEAVKRMRVPKKIQEIAEISVENSAEGTIGQIPEKRGRGRPPKEEVAIIDDFMIVTSKELC